MSRFTRRRFLRLCGAAATAAIPGCSAGDRSTATATLADADADAEPATATATAAATPARAVTDAATETPTAGTARPTRPPSEFTAVDTWTVERLAGRVDALLLPESGPTDDPTGPLYAATRAGEVARIDAEAGRHEWTVTVRGEAVRDQVLAPVEDVVYAVSETFTDERLANHVEALEPATGETRWVFEDRAFLRVLGVVDGLVVLAGESIVDHPDEIGPQEAIRGEGRLYGLDRATGEARWTVDVPELRGADVGRQGVYALERSAAGSADYPARLRLSLRAIDLDGTERWTVDTGTVNPVAPLAAGGLVLAGAGTRDELEQGAVGRYDPVDGSVLWTAGDWRRGPADLTLLDGTVYAGGRPEGLLALGPDGTERFRVRGFLVPEVPATPETLYHGGGSRISAVDRELGELRWRYRPEDHKYTHIRGVLADHVAVDRGIGDDREVVLVGEATGEIVGTFETPGSYFGTVGAGRRLFAGVDSDVVAYDIAV